MNSKAKPGPFAEEAEAIWNPNATVNWSVLFTPAFGSWLQMKNWLSLGEPELAAVSKRWFFGSLITIFAVSALSIFSSSDSSGFSYRYLLGVYLVTWYFASAKAQARYVKERFGEDYNRLPWRKPLLTAVGLTALLIFLNVLFSTLTSGTSAA